MTLYQFIISTVKKAGEILLENYRGNYEKMIKHGDVRNVVTEIDLKINDFLVGEIKKVFPNHAIYSEEGSGLDSGNEFMWALDPIDGSANFSRRIPHFAISICLLKDKLPIAGAVYNPIADELFGFRAGEGAFLNDQPIKVSTVSKISQAGIFMTTGKKPENRNWGAGVYLKLLDAANKTRMFGSSALDICFVADGRIEGVIYGELSTLDIAAALGILTEAGGKITTSLGKPVRVSAEPQKIVASNGTKIHEKLLSLVV